MTVKELKTINAYKFMFSFSLNQKYSTIPYALKKIRKDFPQKIKVLSFQHNLIKKNQVFYVHAECMLNGGAAYDIQSENYSWIGASAIWKLVFFFYTERNENSTELYEFSSLNMKIHYLHSKRNKT